MIRREESDSMSAHKSTPNSEYSTSFVENVCATNPDDAFLTVIDRILHSIQEMPENSCSEVEISDSGKEVNSSMVIADLKELISEIENVRVPSEGSSICCGKPSQNSNSRESKIRSSDLITKNSSVNKCENRKSNYICQDPIRSISLTAKAKGSTSNTNKYSDGSDGDRQATCEEISYESRNMNSNLKDLSKLTKSSRKSSNAPFTEPLISKERQRDHSKRTNSAIPDVTQSVFINSLPSFRSQRRSSCSSSESSINSDTSNFQTGKSTGSIDSTVTFTVSKASPLNSKRSEERPNSSITLKDVEDGISSKTMKTIRTNKEHKSRNATPKSSSSSKRTDERPKSSMTLKDIKNGVSTKSMKTIRTNEEHLKSRNSTPKPLSIDSNLSCREYNSQPSDTVERSVFIASKSMNGLSHMSQKQSRPQTVSSISKPLQNSQSISKSFNGLKVLKRSSALQEDSPNDFQYLPTESGCLAYKSSLSPHQKVDGIPSQTHKGVLFSAKKMHGGESGRRKILKQEWATTRIITFDDTSKTFEVMAPMKFDEIDDINVENLTATVFAVLPNKNTVCYVRH